MSCCAPQGQPQNDTRISLSPSTLLLRNLTRVCSLKLTKRFPQFTKCQQLFLQQGKTTFSLDDLVDSSKLLRYQSAFVYRLLT